MAELRAATARQAATFDATVLTVVDARRAVADAAAIEHMAATIKALAAARVADAGGWRADGARSAPDALARATGSSVNDARETLNLGRRLADQPDVAAAARQGKLSQAQARAVSDAAHADPAAQQGLLERAASSSMADLAAECARVKAAAVDAEQRRRSIRAGRRLRAWTNIDGVWHLHASGNPEDGAQLMSALAPIIDEIFAEARHQGRREPVEAYAFDALIRMATEATSQDHGTPADVSETAHNAGAAQAGGAAGETGTPGQAGAGGAAGGAGAGGAEQPARPGAPGPTPPGPAGFDGPGRGPGRPAGLGLGGTGAGGPDGTGRGGGTATEAPGGQGGVTTGNGDGGGGGVPEGRPARRRGPGGPGRRRRGAPVKLLLRVDYDTFLRGFPLEGETCELAGYGPVSVSAVQDLVAMGDAFVAAVMTRGHQLVGVAHLGRRPNAYQRSALEWLYPTCAAEGCPAQARLEFDHRIDWAKSHVTVLDALDRLCEHHHDLKTRDGWALVAGTTKRPFVAPDDPRHPRHQQPAA